MPVVRVDDDLGARAGAKDKEESLPSLGKHPEAAKKKSYQPQESPSNKKGYPFWFKGAYRDPKP